MGFFKEFKEDFSEAVNELVPGGETGTPSDDVMVNTIDGGIDVDSELAKLDGLLEQATKKAGQAKPAAPAMPAAEEVQPAQAQSEQREKKEEKIQMDTVDTNTVRAAQPQETASAAAATVSDENAVITHGMTIRGNLDSTGSIEVQGAIEGNVNCNGKLIVTGMIRGNSSAAEFFADSAKIEGEVASSGTIKIGVGSVIIGNITASSAVIAGAVKGDIDVQGPVVVDTSAVIMGNIKSRSVQINNGAVIEGFCSQSYSDVDMEGLFS